MKRTKSGTTFEQGELVLLPFPFSDLSSDKRRPALVLSNSVHNSRSDDIIVCAVTSNVDRSEHSVLIDNGDMASGRLPKVSRIRADKIFTARGTLVVRSVGHVRSEITQRVLKELHAVL